MSKRFTIEKINELLNVKKIKFISDFYIRNSDKYNFQCLVCLHIWSQLPRLVIHSTGCPNCYETDVRKNPKNKLTLQKCHDVAENNNGKCLETKYINNKIKMLWECNIHKHQWRASFQDVCGGHWCVKCAVIKRANTNIERYGVSVPAKNLEIAKKTAKSLSKKKTVFHWKTDELMYMAGWDSNVASYFNENKINYSHEPKAIQMPDGRVYIPDFYLQDKDLWIEVKGHFWGDAQEKWDWFHKTYSNSELWDQKKLKTLGIL